ncbi:hypothetical protein JCM11491_006743 [Sporobolomyces phaffii]
MSRRSSLAASHGGPGLPPSSTSSSAAPPTYKSSLPTARRVGSLSSTGPIPRTRSSTSLASRSSTLTGKSAVSSLSNSRARRVLSETQASSSLNNHLAPSSNMSRNATAVRRSASASIASMTSPPRQPARRYSRAEAGGLTGFGVVKAGPRVVSPVKMERETPAIHFGMGGGARESVNDPYSTSFQRTTFSFETTQARKGERSDFESHSRFRGGYASRTNRESNASEEDELYLQSPRKPVAALSPPRYNMSPRKAFSSSNRVSPSKRSPTKRRLTGGGQDENMDTDPTITIPIRPSSPVRGALSPRTLLRGGNAPSQTLRRTKPSRKIEEVDSSSSEDDELDFLSPRKKVKQFSSTATANSLPLSAPTSTSFASTTQPSRVAGVRHSTGTTGTTRTIDRSQLLRSPPPKKPSAVLPARLASVPTSEASLRPQLSSAPMQRTVGRAFPLPSSLPRVPPIPPQPSRPVASSVPAFAHSLPSRPVVSTSSAGGIPRSSLEPFESSSTSSLSRLPRRISNEHANPSVPLPPPAPSALLARPTSPTFADPSLSLMSIDESQEASFSEASNSGDASTMSSTSVRSEETAKRLANLQNMLSRLQMPRKSVGGVGSRRTSIDSNSSIISSSSTSGLGGDEVSHLGPRGGGGSDLLRTALPVPVPSSSSARQRGPSVSRLPSATRPPRGIVDTSNSSFTRPPQSAASSRRISSSFLPSQSFDMSDMSMLSDADMSATAVFSEPTIKAEASSKVLDGVVAFVDVRTGEGDDSGMIFVDMLKTMGARVTTRPSSLTTHIVFKSGRASTLQFVRSCVRPPKVVGIAWVVRCAEIGQRADENVFRVVEDKKETEKENMLFAAGAGKTVPAQKRRRSMEPKALAALNSSTSLTGSSNPALKASIAASLERARLRSLQFAPKVGSPLAKRVFVMPDMTNEQDEDDE